MAHADHVPLAPTEPAVLVATGLVRRLGEGDAAVDALREVDVSIERGKLTDFVL